MDFRFIQVSKQLSCMTLSCKPVLISDRNVYNNLVTTKMNWYLNFRLVIPVFGINHIYQFDNQRGTYLFVKDFEHCSMENI